ncbi:MAG: GTPase HflX [Alphaproteobacteria bacterium]|nr:GTPase HflX [Alphaproteobacteria bacterium]
MPDALNGARQRALVVHPVLKSDRHNGRTANARLGEAMGLAGAINLDIIDGVVVLIARPRPATLLGSGAVEALTARIYDEEIALVTVDAALSPVQQRNLERTWKCKVIDRTGLILEIFGARARTREGALQVELAHLTYQRSRLVRTWTHLERQRGGFGFLGGPGETQIEADRRQIGERIAKLKIELESVRRTRGLHREARQRVPYPVIALVGYTNAGKSTLFNRLTRAEVLAADLLFATLDPTMRSVSLPSGPKVILSDTVGFVSDLPTDLVAAFRATLEEVLEADVIVHVRDIAHPDSEAQKDDVLAVLADLGIGEDDPRIVEVLNKTDLLDTEALAVVRNIAERQERTIALSAVTGEGCTDLLGLIERQRIATQHVVEIEIEPGDGATLAWLYRVGSVIKRTDQDGTTLLQVAIDPADLGRLEARIAQGAGARLRNGLSPRA